jgi:hypothetical protein
MLLYHGTSKLNALLIKNNGFSFEYCGQNWGSTYGKAIYLTNNYKEALFYADEEKGEILKILVLDIKMVKLIKDYSPNDKKHIKEIKKIITYLKINSNKNCLLNLNESEYIFFKTFNYLII